MKIRMRGIRMKHSSFIVPKKAKREDFDTRF